MGGGDGRDWDRLAGLGQLGMGDRGIGGYSWKFLGKVGYNEYKDKYASYTSPPPLTPSQ